eukprot:GHVU01110611.1.p1 GENE.GHVU01110611.1~~GHVU01110611.1.p1  ORF type:complete len:412 (+),score=101.94 GHVU01110611.1:61-1236(+)
MGETKEQAKSSGGKRKAGAALGAGTESLVKKGKATAAKAAGTIEYPKIKSEDVKEVFERHQRLAASSRKFVGAHASAAGGPENAIHNLYKMGGAALSFFTKNPRALKAPPLDESSVRKFRAAAEGIGFDAARHAIPHGIYLVNLASRDGEKAKRSYEGVLEELKRAERLGMSMHNIHPGSTCGEGTKQEAMDRIAKWVNDLIKATKTVKVVFENMAGGVNDKIVGSRFEELRTLIDAVEDKSRVGVCLDTCHLFCSGYDVRTPEAWDATLKKFDSVVGLKYLCAMHLNDSKHPFNCGKDEHENLGSGYIGWPCFEFIMRDSRFADIPLVLETPDDAAKGMSRWAYEIERMYSFLPAASEEEASEGGNDSRAAKQEEASEGGDGSRATKREE